MSRARAAALAAGLVLSAAAVLADVVRGGPFDLGAAQLLLLAAGVGLTAAGGLGPRLPGAWRGAGLLLLNVIVLFGVAELAARMAVGRLPTPRYAGSVTLAWYDSQPWIAPFRAEHEQVYAMYRFAPLLLWEGAPFAGRWISVDSSGRRTTPGAACGDGAWTVWLFGGSAMWGVGAPDSLTIAAFLQTDLAASAVRPICVVNFGERAYVVTQELLRFERELRRGGRPDAAVFYDGANDATYALRYGRADGFQNMDRVERRLYQRAPFAQWVEGWGLSRLLVRLREARGAGEAPGPWARGTPAESLARAVAREVHATHRLAAAIGASEGFPVLSVLQPMIAVGAKPLTGPERDSEQALGPIRRDFYRAVYAAIRASAPPRWFDDASGALDAVSQPVYADWFHVTPAANAIIARRMAGTLTALPGFPRAAPTRVPHGS